MAQPQLLDHHTAGPILQNPARITYRIGRQADAWFITFHGANYGPYKSDREALLFAVDAANKLGEKGEPTEVLVLGDDGCVHSTWAYGHDPYPPRF
jgi:hypothetical protein